MADTCTFQCDPGTWLDLGLGLLVVVVLLSLVMSAMLVGYGAYRLVRWLGGRLT